MKYDVMQHELASLSGQRVNRPHVVILGAGASRAAFPNGDAKGRRLPLMADLVEVLGLEHLLRDAGRDPNTNFEDLYSQLHAANPDSEVIRAVEARVEEYFNGLELPAHQTVYDLLLLALREKDAIFTFNWDPFLVDAIERLDPDVPMPQIFHLHGNVRVAFCEDCGISMRTMDMCSQCGSRPTPTRLLYPVDKKDYGDRFINSQWKCLLDFLKRAMIVTVFGYSAPRTDQEAIGALKDVWRNVPNDRLIDRLEIIDIRDKDELGSQWGSFAFYSHYDVHCTIDRSLLARYARRSCEALFHMNWKGKSVERISITGNLEEMQSAVRKLVTYERTVK